MYFANIFPTLWLVLISSPVSFKDQKLLILMRFNLLTCSFIDYLLVSLLGNLCLAWGWKVFLLCYILELIVLCFTFRSIIHFELISIYSASMNYERVSNLQPTGCTRPRVALNAAQHKIINLIKTLLSFIAKFYTKF